jgi:hypothetical protein
LFLVLSNRTLITGGPLRGLDIHHTSLTTLRKLEGRIISFIDQPGVIKKFFNTLVYGKSP